MVGFHSGKYDINVIKGLLYQSLEKLHDDEGDQPFPAVNQIIKRNSDYMSISTKWFKFLDIKNYLAPGCSYKQFLQAYKCEDKKGFFPYDWMDKLDKLSHTALPPFEAFYNKLKGKNISPEEYQHCKNVWRDQNMRTFRDFLVWYNNKDVGPFLQALENMFDFYRAKNIDMFKQGISIPGLTLRYLFQNNERASFCLIPNNHSDLYQKTLSVAPQLFFTAFKRKKKPSSGETRHVERSLGLMPMPFIYGQLCRKCLLVSFLDVVWSRDSRRSLHTLYKKPLLDGWSGRLSKGVATYSIGSSVKKLV